MTETTTTRPLFHTIEQDRPTSFGPGAWDGQRRYTVRMAREDGSIETPGEFGEFSTLSQARTAARRLAAAEVVAA